MSALLSEDKVNDRLAKLPNWLIDSHGKVITREYLTKNFVVAVEFINKVAELAETVDHHPDIHLTGYRNLRIELSTHSEGGLTEKDFDLAGKINALPIELKK